MKIGWLFPEIQADEVTQKKKESKENFSFELPLSQNQNLRVQTHLV